MKRFTFFMSFFIITFYANCQVSSSKTDLTDHLALNSHHLLLKSKRQKTTAWALMGTGIVITGVGLVYSVIDVVIATQGETTSIGAPILLSGVAMMGASIALFTAGSKNKHRASLLLEKQKLGVSNSVIISRNVYTARLIIPIGR